MSEVNRREIANRICELWGTTNAYDDTVLERLVRIANGVVNAACATGEVALTFERIDTGDSTVFRAIVPTADVGGVDWIATTEVVFSAPVDVPTWKRSLSL